MANVGFAAQCLALVLAVYAVVMAIFGVMYKRGALLTSAKNAALGVTGLLTVSVVSMEYLLITGNYQTEYVASVTNNSAALFFKMTALWGGQAGSLLFFTWMMSVFSAVVIINKWPQVRTLIPYAMGTMQAVLIFFISLITFGVNPFTQLSFIPPDGQGLNPLLYHWGMIIHPPVLYLGFTSFLVPFAFGVAALITKQSGDLWIRTTRRWTLVAWLFLSGGLLLGGRWAYDVLGWGGYWGWDPVENAAFVPWLIATPFLHSAMMQESRGMMKRWNMALVLSTFCLIIEGTFITRSGVVSSVHSFAQSAIGPYFLTFLAILLFGCLFLFIWRWDNLKSDNELDSWLSRESAFLLNNLFFIGIAFTIWWGSHFPIISEALTGDRIVVGPPFFEKATGPLFAALVLLMGVAPLMPWRQMRSLKLLMTLKWPAIVAVATMVSLYTLTWIKIPGAVLGFGFCAFSLTTTLMEYWRGIQARHKAHAENYLQALLKLTTRNRRRYGGYFIHLAVIIAAIGIIGIEFYQIETQQNVARNNSIIVSSPFAGTYELTYRGIKPGQGPDTNVEVILAELDVTLNGVDQGKIEPYREFFIRQQQPMTIPDIHHGLANDLYIIISGWENGGETATFTIYINPLINWLWFGGFLFIIGTLIAIWPTRTRVQQTRSIPVTPKGYSYETLSLYLLMFELYADFDNSN